MVYTCVLCELLHTKIMHLILDLEDAAPLARSILILESRYPTGREKAWRVLRCRYRNFINVGYYTLASS